MLEKPLFMQGNTYAARRLRELVGYVFDVEGVIKPETGALKVGPRAAGANMSVDVAPGPCAILGDDAAGQGMYVQPSTAVENLPIGAAPGSDSRIDLVVARIRDADVTGGVSSDWVLEVIPGAVAVAPVEPALPPSAIRLAAVTIAAGTVSIDAAKITDRRTAATNAAYFAKAGNPRWIQSIDLPSIAANTTTFVDIPAAVSLAVGLQVVMMGVEASLPGLIFRTWGRVIAADTVRLVVTNYGSAAIDAGAANFVFLAMEA
jgi:hypothetical protein